MVPLLSTIRNFRFSDLLSAIGLTIVLGRSISLDGSATRSADAMIECGDKEVATLGATILREFPVLVFMGPSYYSLQTVASIFARVDERLFRQLLAALSGMLGCSTEIAHPPSNNPRLFLVDVLREKRLANLALTQLLDAVRRRAPAAGHKAAEAIQEIRGFIENTVYNARQQKALQTLEVDLCPSINRALARG